MEKQDICANDLRLARKYFFLFQRMAAVGAPGTEMSDEPHIPTVTIVHRFCLNVADPVHLLE